ncbi:MAG TPA: sigma-70 family RNA polymerase sigma factor [Acidimicrobiales bacterium]|nr:sigma-70 family RNA polymerase sigma factor [Acidimicrobiales bacterium]
MGDADRERFELLYAAHYDRVLAYTLCRARVDAARDATAETFLVAWRRFTDVPDDPLPWLIGVARRCLADQRRSTSRRNALAVRLRMTTELPTAWDDDPADAVAERDQVVAAMRRLSPGDGELLRLIAWDGLSSAQAAQSLRCSRATFAVRLHRARRRLAGALAAEEVAEPDTVPVVLHEHLPPAGFASVSRALSAGPEEAS